MISPIEIRQQSFKKGIRGFDADEVKSYLSSLANEWQELLEQNGKLKYELENCGSQLESYKEKENMLGKILEQTESSSQKVLESARKEAEIIKKEAEQKAYQMLQDAYKERSRLEQDINALNGRRNDILVQLKSFLSSQTERIETFKTTEAVKLPTIDPPKPPKSWVEDYEAPESSAPATRSEAPKSPKAEAPKPEAPKAEQPKPASKPESTPEEKRKNILEQAQSSFFDSALADSQNDDIDDLLDEI